MCAAEKEMFYAREKLLSLLYDNNLWLYYIYKLIEYAYQASSELQSTLSHCYKGDDAAASSPINIEFR